MTYRQTLLVLAASALSVTSAGTSFALKTNVCPNVTCTSGGSPSAPIMGTSVTNVLRTEVVPIFWGSSWASTPAPSPSMSQLVGATLYLTNSSYFAALNQYGSLGPVRMAPTAPLYAPGGGDPTNNFTEAQVTNVINQEIQSFVVPPPNANVNTVYVVFLPQGLTEKNFGNSASGFNSASQDNSGRRYSYAWVSGGPSAGNNPTILLSHELTEAVSAFAFSGNEITNCKYTSGGSPSITPNQISDLCQCGAAQENQNQGYVFEGYWSAQDQKCVIPEGWGGLHRYHNGWTQAPLQGATSLRQLYAGPWGLVGTDTNDNLNLYQDASSPTFLGRAGAMFAVGTSAIASISTDAAGVYALHKNSLDGWSALGSPNGGLVTGVYVTENDAIVATDALGQPWRYIPSNGTWAQFGGNAAQFVVSGTEIAALGFDHGSVWTTTGDSKSWSFATWQQRGQNQPAAALVGNSCSTALGLTTLDSSQNIFTWTGSAWDIRGTAANMFEVGTGGTDSVAALWTDRKGISFQSGGFASWNQIDGSAGRLVGGCDLYATYCTSSTACYLF